MNKKKPDFQLHWSANENKRILPPDDAKTAFHLFDCIDTFVGKNSGIFERIAATGKLVDGNTLRKEVHDYWYDNTHMIDLFLESSNGQSLTVEQKNILLGWKHTVRGEFLCIKYYTRSAVFRSFEKNCDDHYNVLGLTNDFQEVIPDMTPPYIATTALLPYKDVIIWDGIVSLHPLRFGRNMRNTFMDDYQ